MVDVLSPAVVVLVIEKTASRLLADHSPSILPSPTFASRWHVLDVLELIVNSQSIFRPAESSGLSPNYRAQASLSEGVASYR